jgi:hypothetical protein
MGPAAAAGGDSWSGVAGTAMELDLDVGGVSSTRKPSIAQGPLAWVAASPGPAPSADASSLQQLLVP